MFIILLCSNVLIPRDQWVLIKSNKPQNTDNNFLRWCPSIVNNVVCGNINIETKRQLCYRFSPSISLWRGDLIRLGSFNFRHCNVRTRHAMHMLSPLRVHHVRSHDSSPIDYNYIVSITASMQIFKVCLNRRVNSTYSFIDWDLTHVIGGSI